MHTFSDELKFAEFVPVFKKNYPIDKVIFRPISLRSLISKIYLWRLQKESYHSKSAVLEMAIWLKVES